MKVEFLLQFKSEKIDLDTDFMNLINNLKENKNFLKKKKFKTFSKNNILKNNILQEYKKKVEFKLNLLLNKLSIDNFDLIIKEFIEKFNDIDQENYNIILKELYINILKNDKFTDLFVKFYHKINNIYNYKYKFNNSQCIDMVEYKTQFDYNVIEKNLEFDFLNSFDSEENKINNLKLICFLINSNNLKKNIIDEISKMLLNSDVIPSINFWFLDENIKDNIKYNFNTYNNKLNNKLNNDLNNRYKIILKNLLDKLFNNKDPSENIVNTEKLIIEDNDVKNVIEIEAYNIIEEYLLLEDLEEIKTYINENSLDNNNLKYFFKESFNCYFNNNLTNLDKFKKLFLFFKENINSDSKIYENSIIELIKSDATIDYINYKNKLKKLIETLNLLKININIDNDIVV